MAKVETVKVMRGDVEVTINKCDLKHEVKKESAPSVNNEMLNEAHKMNKEHNKKNKKNKSK